MMEWLPVIAGAAGKAFDFMNARSASKDAAAAQKAAFGNRIKDAQKYGIHPLAALGANINAGPSVSAFSDFGSMGQDVSRAVNATKGVDDRLQNLILRNWELRNLQLEKSIQKDQIGPAVPYETGGMTPLIPGQGAVVSAGAGWDEYPSVVNVQPPNPTSQAGKHFGYSLVPNPRRFTMPKYMQDILGDEGIGQFIHTTGNYLDMLGRAFVRYHSPRFEARRRQWHGE